MLVAGCGGAAEGTSSRAETKATPMSGAAPATKPTPTPTPEATPNPALPSAPYVPTRPLPEIVVVDPASTCPELPALPTDASEDRKALHQRAAAIRRLACEPALFARTTDELRTALGLSPEDELEFSGLRGVRLRLPGEPTVADVAAVFGIASPQVHVTWQAYHPRTSLGTNPTTGVPPDRAHPPRSPCPAAA